MCGICGIINLENKKEINKKLLLDMTNLLYHRGPDAGGIYIDSNIGFGHRRLRILDLRPTGNQPMISECNSVIIVHNGEIYNFLEIKEELIKKGYKFKSNTDTEVIIYSYLEYGINCLEKFNGMFAFSIYDIKNKKVYIVRDRLGIKPLYYSNFDGKFIFASEIKSILKYPNFKREVDFIGISSYLSYRYPIYDMTLYKNIKSLLPGHYIEIDLIKNHLKLIKYWELPIYETFFDKGENYYINKIKFLLKKSVKYRIISDVPVGAYLSGGLDSSIIVALMSKISNSSVKTFTIGFEEEGFNEFYYAKLVANMYNTKHYEILLSGKNYIEEMIKLIDYKDAPLSIQNEPALYVMSRELKKYITVVLSGEGSDEIFGGYGRIFRSPYDYERMKSLFEQSDNLKEEIIVKELQKNLIKKYNSLNFNSFLDFFLNQYQYIKWEEKKFFLSKDLIQSLDNDYKLKEIYVNYFQKLDKLDFYNKLMWIFEKIHIVGLLHRVDITTMATSVEARVPFVDHRLLEFVLSIPVKYKLKWKSLLHKICSSIYNSDQISEKFDIPKYILKKSFEKDLPKKVIYRKKMGFPVPLHRWFGEDFNNFAKDILLSNKARKRGIYNIQNIEKFLNNKDLSKKHKLGLKLWMLVNLEIWFQKYIDRSF